MIYWWHCTNIKQEYYGRRRNEAAKWKCQPDRWLSPELEKEEMITGTLNSGLATFYALSFMRLALTTDHTSVYFDLAEHTWSYYICSLVAMFLWIEVWAYWSHRFWHIKALYRHFHKWHHRYQPPTPFSAVAFHPFEFAVVSPPNP